LFANTVRERCSSQIFQPESRTESRPAMSQPLSTGHPRKWLILALVLAAECMDLLDGTIVNVAAPSISVDLRASTSALQWVIGGYALAFAVGLVTGGRLGDIYGRRKLFVIGAFGFVAASLACAFAVDPGMLIATRLAQGTAAALLIPQGLGIIRDAFPGPELSKAFALFGPVIGLSAVLGPILGGVLVDADVFGTGWRLIFFVNLPLGLAAAIGAMRIVPESRAPRRPRLDLVGTGLVVAAISLVIYPLIQGREAGWPVWTYLMMAGGVAVFGALAAWTVTAQRRGVEPLVEVSIFGHRAYSAGLAMILVFFAGMAGTLLVLTLFLQLGEGFSAIHAGLTLAPFALGSAVGAAIGMGLLVPRIGRNALLIGCVLMGAGTGWLCATVSSHGLGTTTGLLIAPQLVFGVGLGLMISPLFDFVLASVTDDEVGSASGVLNAVQQLAGALGVAVIGTIFFSAVSHSGYVTAITRSLLVELGLIPVLMLLVLALPQHPRESEAVIETAAEDAEPAYS
jgi:EmrB/QacA subfamily drug resistance transporter